MIGIDIRSPRSGEWFRVNPDPKRRDVVALVEDPDGGTPYLLEGEALKRVQREIPDKIMWTTLFMACNKAGENFLWPVPNPVGKDDLAFQAMDKWVCFPVMH